VGNDTGGEHGEAELLDFGDVTHRAVDHDAGDPAFARKARQPSAPQSPLEVTDAVDDDHDAGRRLLERAQNGRMPARLGAHGQRRAGEPRTAPDRADAACHRDRPACRIAQERRLERVARHGRVNLSLPG